MLLGRWDALKVMTDEGVCENDREVEDGGSCRTGGIPGLFLSVDKKSSSWMESLVCGEGDLMDVPG